MSRNEKVIPRERISSLDTTQGPLQRLFSVLELRVQTPGGGARRRSSCAPCPAATRRRCGARRACGRGGADARRQAAPHTGDPPRRRAHRPAARRPPADRRWHRRRGPGRHGQRVAPDVDGLPDTAGQWLLVAAGVIALAWLLSIAGAVVTFAGFEVVRDGDRLRTRSGLFARRAATLPLSRVQGVRMVEGLLREPFGLATLRVETAGYAGQGAVTQTLFPLVRRRDAAAVIDRFVPALAGSLDALQPAPARARRSYLIGPVLLALAACVLIALLWRDGWPAIPVLLVLAAGLGELRFRAAGWRLDDGRVVLRSRDIGRSTLVASTRRLQEHGTRQTPLQRRRRLADVTVAVGSRRRARVRHLEAATAQRLLGLLRPS